jgi:hypothetical protein
MPACAKQLLHEDGLASTDILWQLSSRVNSAAGAPWLQAAWNAVAACSAELIVSQSSISQRGANAPTMLRYVSSASSLSQGADAL